MAGEVREAVISPDWFDFLSPEFREALAFSIRTWIAGSLALYIAFKLQLESPYWAPIATWIVSQPKPGMTLSKSLYRVVGSIVGAIVGVILIAVFAQTPELFIVALALWLGACTVVSNLLRNFRSYGAVLAGYTAAIVALAAYAAPNQVFYIAMARGTCTILGIGCSALVTRFLAPHHARVETINKLHAVIGDTARRAAFPLAGRLPYEAFVLAQKLITDLIDLDTSIEFAAAESASFRIHANRARSQLAHLFGVISAARALEALNGRCGPIPTGTLAEIRDEALTLMVELPGAVARREIPQMADEVQRLRERLEALNPEAGTELTVQMVNERLYIDHLTDLLERMEGALRDSMSLEEPWEKTPRLNLDFHRDHRLAFINGLRATVAILIAGTFWIASAWSSGSLMLIQAAVVCSLFSTLPRPDLAGMTFLYGSLAGSVLGFAATYGLLMHVGSNFELLMAVIGLIMIPGGMLGAFPRTMLLGFSLNIVFLVTVQPLNPMNYNIIAFLNNTVATVVGVFFGSIAYTLLFPTDLMAAHRYVLHRIRRAFEILAEREPAPPLCAWQSRMFDRVSRLYNSANILGDEREKWMENGLDAMNAGNSILRLRQYLETPHVDPAIAKLARSMLDDFARFRENSSQAIKALLETLNQVRELVPPEELNRKRMHLRIRGALEEVDAFFASHPQFLGA